MVAIAEKNWTLREALAWAEEYLHTHEVPEPKAEAEYLLSQLLNCKRSGLYLNDDKPLAIDEWQRFMDWLNRRVAREPAQYIIGEQEFWGLAFKVNRDVLIARPETELLVEEAVKTVRCQGPAPAGLPSNGSIGGFKQGSEVGSQNTKTHYSELWTPNSELIILDLCSGSGCIAIALAKEIPDSKIFAVDISEKALNIAEENAERHKVADRITFIHGDLFGPPHSPLPFFIRENSSPPLWKRGVRGDFRDKLKFDLIVSNPPYISKKMMAGLEPEVKDYEPVTALYGGEDGLDFYRRIISEAPKYLAKDGCILLEMGYGQAEEIKELIEHSKTFEHIVIKKDFAGIDRVIKAQKKG